MKGRPQPRALQLALRRPLPVRRLSQLRNALREQLRNRAPSLLRELVHRRSRQLRERVHVPPLPGPYRPSPTRRAVCDLVDAGVWC
ncbi:hypothetical protein [Mumia zhuanghuii]|uniref:Uncharacterized protein n=1 Tax=Mumia zhuanghuii TaxID=2585211 RepID=A0A5C4LXM3_9ACTN|nr:hypothetical protein [Mumia zhuanghuii]TNC21767.1 hypothetical protein FHE65_36290 [Mumia zhuanghuii]